MITERNVQRLFKTEVFLLVIVLLLFASAALGVQPSPMPIVAEPQLSPDMQAEEKGIILQKDARGMRSPSMHREHMGVNKKSPSSFNEDEPLDEPKPPIDWKK